MTLYDETAFKSSKLITNHYSTSFSLGIKTLARKYHKPIYAIYGFVRYADEIVDTFHDYDKTKLLEEFRNDTFKAIDQKISLNPVLHSFQVVVNAYHIDTELIEAFLDSMAMDLTQTEYDEQNYKQYIYGSAEVVGLMCLKVFCEGDEEMYQKLLSPAKSLGSAFQKVNFLRDIKQDMENLGRSYFPNVHQKKLTDEVKKEIIADIEQDFEKAYEGLVQLPIESRLGVYIAYKYYSKLLKKLKCTNSEKLMNARIHISNPMKMLILAKGYVRYKLNAF